MSPAPSLAPEGDCEMGALYASDPSPFQSRSPGRKARAVVMAHQATSLGAGRSAPAPASHLSTVRAWRNRQTPRV